MKAERFAHLVRGARRVGSGYVAHCPAHDDERESLSFTDGGRGLVVKCHAGCLVATITAAVNLRVADLFNDQAARGRNGSRVVAEYEYRDEGGELLYVVERREPKTFRQRRPDGRGGWTWNLDGVRRVLYRLRELRGHGAVYIVEGEKDADRLAALGLPATTNAGGAGKWREEYTEQLRAASGERVVMVILPDNDPSGEAHACAVARSCVAAGLVAKIVRLPGLSQKGDVSDWLDAGHGREELEAVVNAATPVDGATFTTTDADSAPVPAGLTFTTLRDLLAEPEEVHAWLVEGRLPSAGLSLLAGKPKAGKSTAARCLALAVARGEPWLGFPTTQGTVLYLGLEEKRPEVRRHFEAMGARGDDDPVLVFCASAPADGLAQLRAAAETHRPVLIIVDPLFRLVRVPDGNDYATVTAALEPLLALARQTGAHVLAVHHLGKGERVGGDAILGSTAIFAAVDTALLLRRSDRYRTLSTIQRYGADLDELVVTLDPVARTLSAGPSRAEADEMEASREILMYLAAQSEPVEEAAIRQNVEGRPAAKVRALRRLVADGSVIRTGEGKRGDPYRYAVSRSLVPDTCREPENQNPKTGVSADRDGEDSGSRPSAALQASREPETDAVLDL